MSKDKKEAKKMLLLKLNTQKQKASQKFEKVPHLLESFFETLVDKHSSHIYLLDALAFVSAFFTTLFYSVSIYGNGPPEDKENKAQKDIVIPKIFIGFLLISSLMFFGSKPKKYEHRSHFTDIGRNGMLSSLVYTIAFNCYVVISMSAGLMTYDPHAMIGLLVTYLLCHFSAFIKVQRCTKLRFKPDSDNIRYSLINAVSKDKGSICIVESNVFKITLMNVGIKTWESSDFSIHRHTGTGKNGKCVEFSLPYFTLEVEQQIDLIPETFEFEGACIRIPKLHCFGAMDRSTEVKTFIADKERRDDSKEDDSITECTCYSRKVAEYIATYNDYNDWTNIYVY